MGVLSPSVLAAAKASAEEKAKNERYMYDIRSWAKDKLGYTLWNKQVEIAEALIKHRRVAVKSGHGVGKSFTASVILAWFVDTRKDLDALAVSTAPTQNQLGIVWEYVRDHHRKAGLYGRVTLDNDYKGDNDSMRAMGRKPSSTNEHAFQGQHRRNGVFAIIDEACGVPDSIFTGVDVITTGKFDYALCVGNPDDINTPFGRIFKNEESSWHRMTISSLDSPNFTGEPFPEDAKGGLVTPEWVASRKIEWGEDSPRYKSKVLGEFSEDASSKMFSVSTLAKGGYTELSVKQDSTPVLGCDIARMGEDYTVIYSYQDGVARFVDKWAKTDLYVTAERIRDHAWNLGAKEVRIDGVGVGAGVYDILPRLSDGRFEVVGMIGNGASPDLDQWINIRAYWWDNVRARMDKGEIDMDAEDMSLKDELGDVDYHFKNNRNALQVEKKDDIKLRTGKSPDFADAFIYACANTGIDPTDPQTKFRPGEEYSMALEEFLSEEERIISIL